jgi:hypothetical protein
VGERGSEVVTVSSETVTVVGLDGFILSVLSGDLDEEVIVFAYVVELG